MSENLVRTKLNVPPLRPNLVPRSRLIERLNKGLQPGYNLTPISVPADFGNTILAREWLAIVNDGTTARLQAADEAVLLSRGDLLPTELTFVPSTWHARFRCLAKDMDLGFADLDEAMLAAISFILF